MKHNEPVPVLYIYTLETHAQPTADHHRTGLVTLSKIMENSAQSIFKVESGRTRLRIRFKYFLLANGVFWKTNYHSSKTYSDYTPISRWMILILPR